MTDQSGDEIDYRVIAEIAKARIDNDAHHISTGADPGQYGYGDDYSFSEAKDAVEQLLEEVGDGSDGQAIEDHNQPKIIIKDADRQTARSLIDDMTGLGIRRDAIRYEP